MSSIEACLKRIEAVIPELPGWCSPEKGVAMAELIFEHRPPVSVELGVFGGRSMIAQAIAHEFIGHGHVYGVDAWTKEAAIANVEEVENIEWWSSLDYEDIYHGCLIAMIENEVTNRCSVFRTTNEKACRLFEEIDVLHIDGNHSEAQSTLDVFLYLPKVRKGGFIWFDDTDWKSTANAVRLLQERCELVTSVGNCALFRKS